jgi:hypothetical protein
VVTDQQYITRWLAAESSIKIEHPEAIAVEWSREEREVHPPEQLIAGHLQQPAPGRRD